MEQSTRLKSMRRRSRVKRSEEESLGYNKKIERIMDIVKEKFAIYEFTVDRLAMDVGISRSYLVELVHMNCNCSPGKLIETFRINEMMRLCTGQEFKNFYQICKCVGYRNVKTMRLAFKRRLGLNPDQFRKSIIHSTKDFERFKKKLWDDVYSFGIK